MNWFCSRRHKLEEVDYAYHSPMHKLVWDNGFFGWDSTGECSLVIAQADRWTEDQ